MGIFARLGIAGEVEVEQGLADAEPLLQFVRYIILYWVFADERDILDATRHDASYRLPSHHSLWPWRVLKSFQFQS